MNDNNVLRTSGGIFSDAVSNFRNKEYSSREEIEVLLLNNKMAFLDMLENNQKFRDNFQVLLETWNNSDIVKLASYLQSDEYRNPINNKLVIIEPMAVSFLNWTREQQKQLETNKYHELSSFEAFREKQRKDEIEEMEENARRQKHEEQKKKYYESEKEKYKQQSEMGLKIAMMHSMINAKLVSKSLNMIDRLNYNMLSSDKFKEFLQNNHSASYEYFNNYYQNIQNPPLKDNVLKSAVSFSVSILEMAKISPEDFIKVYGQTLNKLRGFEGLTQEQMAEKIKMLSNSEEIMPIIAELIKQQRQELEVKYGKDNGRISSEMSKSTQELVDLIRKNESLSQEQKSQVEVFNSAINASKTARNENEANRNLENAIVQSQSIKNSIFNGFQESKHLINPSISETNETNIHVRKDALNA